MNISKLIVVAALAASLVGCGANPTKPEPYEEGLSRAKNLAWPAGYTRIQDAKADPALAQVAGNSRGMDFALHSGAMVMNNGLVGLVSPLSAVNALSLLKADEPWEMPSVFGWMPRGEAVDAEEAYRKYFEILGAALDGTSAEMTISPNHDRFRKYEVSFSKRPRMGNGYLDTQNCNMEAYREGSFGCAGAVAMRGEAVAAAAPELIGGYDAWGLLSLDGKDTTRLKFAYMKRDGRGWDIFDRGESPRHVNELAYWVEFSKHLPEWMFVYLPPNKVSVDEEGNVLAMPVVIEQGKLNFFVKPIPSDAVAQTE